MNFKFKYFDRGIFNYFHWVKLALGSAFLLTTLLATQSFAVDFSGTVMNMETDTIAAQNNSTNKIKICAFDGTDKALLIPSSKATLSPNGKMHQLSCTPNNKGKCQLRFLKPNLDFV